MAWFNTNTNRLVQMPNNPPWFSSRAAGSGLDARRDAVVPRFIDLSLRGRRTNDVGRLQSYPVANGSFVDHVLNQEIVLERSPPDSLPLLNLLAKGSYFTLGSFLGYKVGGDSAWIMCFSVPGGVIAMGAAMGVAKGLYNGLSRLIEHGIAGEH